MTAELHYFSKNSDLKNNIVCQTNNNLQLLFLNI